MLEERVWEANKKPPNQDWHRDVRSPHETDDLAKVEMTKEYRRVRDLVEHLKLENLGYV